MTYATDKQLALATELGYWAEKSQQWGHRFGREPRRVWSTAEKWMTADVIENHYCNHKGFPSLDEALRRE